MSSRRVGVETSHLLRGVDARVRLLGVIEAEQTEKGKTARNDRLIAVATDSRTHREFESLDEVNDQLLDEIEHFFVSYNDDKESALLVTLDPGSYTAVIRGKNNTTGIALVEVYQIP